MNVGMFSRRSVCRWASFGSSSISIDVIWIALANQLLDGGERKILWHGYWSGVEIEQGRPFGSARGAAGCGQESEQYGGDGHAARTPFPRDCTQADVGLTPAPGWSSSASQAPSRDV